MRKRQVRAAEYRDRALESAGLAKASVLDHVREKHEIAAARWSQLAALNDREEEGGPVEAAGPDLDPAAAANPRPPEDIPCTA